MPLDILREGVRAQSASQKTCLLPFVYGLRETEHRQEIAMMMRVSPFIVIVAAVVLLPFRVLAQNDSIDIDGGKLQEVHTSAMPVGGVTTAVMPVQTVSHAEMRVHGLRSVNDVVRRMAGVSVRDYGGIGGLRTVSVRNMGSAHTAVVYDGLVVSNTQAGQVDIGRYQTVNLSAVTLAVGQTESLSASARQQSSGSVLEINSRYENIPFGIECTLFTGSYGLAEGIVRTESRLSDRMSVSANASYMRADGAYRFILRNGSVKTKEKRYNSDVWSLRGETDVRYVFSDSATLHAKMGYYRSERGLPGSVVLYNSKADERMWDENIFFQSLYRRKIGHVFNLTLRAKYEHSYDRYEDTDVRYPSGMQRNVNRQDEYYTSGTLVWHPERHVTLALAQDVFLNKLRNNIDEEPNPLRLSFLTALSACIDCGQLQVDGRVVSTYVTENVERGAHPCDRKRVSPTLSLRYQPWRDIPLFLRAMVKNTFRLPSFNDMYYLRMGNRKLRPENAVEYNFGITGILRESREWQAKFTSDIYYNKVTDKIVAFPATYVWKMANFGHAEIMGADLTASIKRTFSSCLDIAISLNYSYQEAKDKTEKGSYSYGRQLPYTPRHSGNMMLTVGSKWVDVGYNVTAMSTRWSMMQRSDDYRLAPFAEHNVTFSRRFCVLRHQADLSASIMNIFNRQYDVVKFYPMPGRTFYFNITFKL